MGFVIVIAGMLYLLISIGVVAFAVSYAKKNGKSARRWDWIPTVVTHHYYCTTEAWFWVYKTPEQWSRRIRG